MKYILTSTILLVTLFIGSASADLSLVWSDEFNGSNLNSDNWNIDIGNGSGGWGNQELQYYRAENVSVSDGNLVLTTNDIPYGGFSFTSGKVHTRNKQFFRYGRIEMRAKIPTGGGMWPAFWMMPQYSIYGGWAASGEIDIMEAANATTSVGGSLHFGGSWPNNTYTTSSYSMGGANFADEFHIYAVEWDEDQFRWYVDDVLYATKYSWQWYCSNAPENPLAPFDQEFYIILNSAIGGTYTGCLNPGCITANLPQEYLIDYVRVYQETPNISPEVAITSPSEGDILSPGNITINATASDEDGMVVAVEFYGDSVYLGSDSTEPYSFIWNDVDEGCFVIEAKAIDDAGGFATDSVDITVGSGCGQEPYHGNQFVLPALIQVEDFDIGGQSISYYDTDVGNTGSHYRPSEDVDLEVCQDSGGGYNLGWTYDGEWLEYSVNVPQTGNYIINTRVSSLSDGGDFHIEFNGIDVTGNIEVPVTSGWQSWETVSVTAELSAGPQIMKFVSDSSGYNVNYFDIQMDVTAVLPELHIGKFDLLPCYPNPFNPSTIIRYDILEPSVINLHVYDVNGKLVKTLINSELLGVGSYEANWNGTYDSGHIAAAGAYFCKIYNGEYQDTIRMILVK